MRHQALISNAHSVTGNDPLSDDQIRRVAPSIFADGAHDSRSSRYAYIPTIEVLNALRKEGFQPFMVAQSRVRTDDRREHTKHMLRLRHSTGITAAEANEVVIINSHDGTSSYQMFAGVLRFVCMNGMICGEGLSALRVLHTGDVVDNVIEGAYTIINEFERIDQNKERMRSITLSPRQQLAFGKAALSLKYDDAPPVTPEQVIAPKRVADVGSDLWRTFNRVQENLLKGGQPGTSTTGRRLTTRKVTGIHTDVKLNRALWTLADALADKVGA